MVYVSCMHLVNSDYFKHDNCLYVMLLYSTNLRRAAATRSPFWNVRPYNCVSLVRLSLRDVFACNVSPAIITLSTLLYILSFVRLIASVVPYYERVFKNGRVLQTIFQKLLAVELMRVDVLYGRELAYITCDALTDGPVNSIYIYTLKPSIKVVDIFWIFFYTALIYFILNVITDGSHLTLTANPVQP